MQSRILENSTGWNSKLAEVDPQPRAVEGREEQGRHEQDAGQRAAADSGSAPGRVSSARPAASARRAPTPSGRPQGLVPGLAGIPVVPAGDDDVADPVQQRGQRKDDRVGVRARASGWPCGPPGPGPGSTPRKGPRSGGIFEFCPRLGDDVERDDQQRAEEEQAEFGAPLGFGAEDVARECACDGLGDGTGRIVVVRGRIAGDIPSPATLGRRPLPMTQTQPQHQPQAQPAAGRRRSAESPGRGRRRGRRGRAPDPTDVPADRGLRLPALHQPGAVPPRLRLPPPRPGRGRRAAAARAGQVPRHLLRAARRVLPNTGGGARGPGRGRRADPQRRRPAARRAADHDPRPGRGAGAPPGPHLLGPHRARPGAGRHPPLGLVLAR